MNETQRNLYFGAVCVALLGIGVLMLAFAAKTAHAAVLYDYSTLDGNTATIQSSGGPNLVNYGTGGTYGFGSPSMTGSISYLRIKPHNATSVSDCPVSTGATMLYGVGGTTQGSIGTPTYDSASGTCTYSISPSDLKAVAFSPVAFSGNDGKILDTTSTSDLTLADGNTGSVNTPFVGFALQVCDSGGCSGGFAPIASRTSISVVDPTQGTTTPSNTFDISVSYTIGTDLNSFSLDGSLPSQIGINLTLLNTLTNQQINLGTDYSISQTTGTYTYATTTTQQSSDYTLIATLVGDYGFTPPPPDCTPYPPFTTCTGSGNISTLATALPPPTFSVNNGLFPILGFQVGSTTSRAGLATTTCSITSIGGCFQNALAFLFFPSPNILDQFALLWRQIENKPPFGYVSQTITGLRSINASSTPAFSFGNIPLISTIFTPFRTGLTAILWIGFFIAWYRGRLRHLDI